MIDMEENDGCVFSFACFYHRNDIYCDCLLFICFTRMLRHLIFQIFIQLLAMNKSTMS